MARTPTETISSVIVRPKEVNEDAGSCSLMASKSSGYVNLRDHQRVLIKVICLLDTPARSPSKIDFMKENIIKHYF